MELKEDDEMLEPVSPTAQCFNSSVFSLSAIAVLECEIPIDHSKIGSFVADLIPLNPLFSSIMVKDINGERKWKKVEVDVEEHIVVRTLASDLSHELYDAYVKEYISNLALEEFPQIKPWWEIHIINHPNPNPNTNTNKATAGNLVLKIHHSLGDGYSMMGLLLSSMKRLDNPSLPLTFPSRRISSNLQSPQFLSRTSQLFISCIKGVLDFGWSMTKSTALEDDLTPVRSGSLQFNPISIHTITFSLHQIKQIKSKLTVTINDVVTGMVFLGIRLYMQETDPNSTKSNTTALIVLNTRMFENYKSIQEMLKPNSDAPWGNRLSFLHINIPKVTDDSELSKNPLKFIYDAQKLIDRKRNSSAVFLTGKLVGMIHKFWGPEVAAKYFYKTSKNSSLCISNMIGPKEKIALNGHPIKGIYFTVVGAPQSLVITVISYLDSLRITFGSEKDFIDQEKLTSCMKRAFEQIHKVCMEEIIR